MDNISNIYHEKEYLLIH